MASREYKDKLRIENPEKYKLVYGTTAKSKYLKRLKENDPEKFKNRTKNNSLGDRVGQRRRALLRKYNLTELSYSIMLESQKSKCKCCRVCLKENRAYIDHCHNSGKVRGLLCLNCNVALGHVKDDVKTLKSLIKYLENGSH